MRARVLHYTFTVSAPRKAPQTQIHPHLHQDFHPKPWPVEAQSSKKTKIFIPSLGQWRPRAQKEMTQHQTSQKILAQASPNPNIKAISLQKTLRNPRHVARRPWLKWGSSIANTIIFLDSQFFALFSFETSSSTTHGTPRAPKRRGNSRKFIEFTSPSGPSCLA